MYIFFAHYITPNTTHDRRKCCKFPKDTTRSEILSSFNKWLEEERKNIEDKTGLNACIKNCKIIE